jgi:hypothetical protein
MEGSHDGPMGAFVAITGRDRGRTQDAAGEICAAGGMKVKVFVADLPGQAQVRRLASEVTACRGLTYWSTTPVANLAPVLLTNLLLGRLERAARPAWSPSPPTPTPSGPLTSTTFWANCAAPAAGPYSGILRSRGRARIHRLLVPLVRPVMKSPAQGAATSVHQVSTPELEQVSGRYFANRRPTRSSTRSYDQAVAARLWEASADLVGLTASPRV